MYFYWPYKKVPSWLEEVDPSSSPDENFSFHHTNFGIVINLRGFYLVYSFIGNTFCKLSNAKNVTITGGGRGVIFCISFLDFISLIKNIQEGIDPLSLSERY